VWLAAAAVVVTLGVVVAFPLAVYTTTLAAFGLAHVLSELRYVDLRFGPRFGRALRIQLGVLLVGVAGSRLGVVTGLISGMTALRIELCLLAALVGVVFPVLARSRLSLGVGLMVGLGALAGMALSPIHTLLVLALAHNLTPLGFLAEVLPPERRAVGLGLGFGVFVGIPLVIATGLPYSVLASAGLAAPEAALLSVGSLSDHLHVYIPRAFHETPWALHAFSAVVFAQCMHYAAVLHVLPRLLPDGADASRSVVPWPPQAVFVGAIALASVAFLGVFAWDFGQARGVYGIVAAVHAWVEVPLLLVALAPRA